MCKLGSITSCFSENEPTTESGPERAAEIKPMIWADTNRYEGFRQVHDIHKYFDKISDSVVCSVCPTCHYCIGFRRFWPNFFAVLRFWMIFSSVLRFLIYPNVPLSKR